MANIRGFGDQPANNRGGGGGFGGFGGGGRGGGGGGGDGGDDYAVLTELVGFGRDTGKDPRNETFFDMIHNSFCPTLKWNSFTTIVSLINITIFIICLITAGINTGGGFLEVNGGWIMRNFAQNPQEIIQNYQYYRLLTACLLHLDFLHIVFNTFSLVIWGSFIEHFTGTKKYALVYVFAGITGSLVSTDIHWNQLMYGVGASGAIFGVVAALIGMLILNWQALSEGRYERIRGMLTCIVIMIAVFTMLSLITPSSSAGRSAKTDNWGHFGGFLGGLFISMAIGRIFGRGDGPYEKKVRVIGWVLSSALLVGTIIPLFTRKIAQS